MWPNKAVIVIIAFFSVSVSNVSGQEKESMKEEKSSHIALSAGLPYVSEGQGVPGYSLQLNYERASALWGINLGMSIYRYDLVRLKEENGGNFFAASLNLFRATAFRFWDLDFGLVRIGAGICGGSGKQGSVYTGAGSNAESTWTVYFPGNVIGLNGVARADLSLSNNWRLFISIEHLWYYHSRRSRYEGLDYFDGKTHWRNISSVAVGISRKIH